MEQRPLGHTGLRVSALGLGAGHLDGLTDAEAARLLHGALDLGITLIDTARGYGVSEALIGRHLAGRRNDFVLSTKGGYGAEGTPDWTPEAITRGVEQALCTLRTDRIDVFHLHSCPLDVLRREELLRALEGCVAAGQVRVAAYSGENEALAFALASGRFGVVQCSVNPFDQRALTGPIRQVGGRTGVIGKRPLANAPWRYAARPAGAYVEPYWERWQAMRPALSFAEGRWAEVSLRFGAFAAGVSSVIVGTTDLAHLAENAALVAKGPLPETERAALEAAFAEHDARARAAGGDGWTGQI